MSFTAAGGRQRLYGDLARAIERLSVAVASLGEAYELLDERLGDSLEEGLFRPVRLAYGRATRTLKEFASRHGDPAASVPPGSSGAHTADPRAYVQRALDAVSEADQILGELQDSMLPIEVGDRELRDGLAEVRTLIAATPARGRDLLRTVGR